MKRHLFMTMLFAAIAGGGYIYQVGPKLPDVSGVFSSDEPAQVAAGAANVPPLERASKAIRIATFNVEVFGEAKLNRSNAMSVIVDVIRRFDVVAIQEIRSKNQGVVPQLVEMVNANGSKYHYLVGERLGRTSSKEQYAYIYNTASIEVDLRSVYTVNDPDDLLHREPMVAGFRVRGPSPDEAFTFTLVNIHTDPDEVDQEINVLDNVVQSVRRDGRGEDDVILLGDLNADYKHLGELGGLPNITWVISGDVTNTRRTASYDNILFDRTATSEFTGRGGVLDLMETFGISTDEALEASDHMPVWAELSIFEGGHAGAVASRPAPPTGEATVPLN